MNKPVIDFTSIGGTRKKRLFLKRPKGFAVPVGADWRCICGSNNKLTELSNQYCITCGTKLTLQENAEATSDYWSLIVVMHFGNY